MATAETPRPSRAVVSAVTFTDHSGLWGQSWVALSSCGHYALRLDTSNPRSTKYQALYIPGVWSQAQSIGTRVKRADAEALCETHSLTPDFKSCASGI